jgi:osmoprotectant transport system permease protein
MTKFKKFVNQIDFLSLTAVFIMLSGVLNPGFFSVAENRIVSGLPLSIEDIMGKYYFGFYFVCFFLILRSQQLKILKFISLIIFFYLILYFSGSFAAKAVNANQAARFTPSFGFWIFFLGLSFFYISYFSGKNSKYTKFFLQIVLILPLIIFIYLGVFSDFAIGREFSLNSQRFFLEIKTHIFISYGSVFFAAIIGIWLGIYTYKSNKKETKLFYFLNIIQTIPGIALFGIVMVPLGFISSSFSGLKNIGISGIGTAPAMLVLFLYSLLPVVKNTLEGLKSIDGSIIESGRGMGMSGFEIFLKIELPLSIPVILNGIRIALVHCVGSTAVAALIGAGGLGVFIFQGIGQGASDLIVLGSLPLIIIAVITDKFMELMTNIFKPKGSFS